jgi:hypothetical protein
MKMKTEAEIRARLKEVEAEWKANYGKIFSKHADLNRLIKEFTEDDLKEHKDDSVAIPDDDLVDTSNYETEDPGLNMQSHQTIDLIKEEVGKI